MRIEEIVMGSDEYRKQLLEHILLYSSNDIAIIPLRFKGKEPPPGFPIEQYINSDSYDPSEYVKITSIRHDINLGIILGKPSKCLVVIDVDDIEELPRFRELGEPLGLLKSDTWVVKTGKGLHYYYRLEDCGYEKRKKFNGIDVLGKGYVVAPPSIHASGSRYEFITDPNTIQLKTIPSRNILKFIEVLSGVKTNNATEFTKILTHKQVSEIIELLTPFYTKGYRHNITTALTGLMMKNGYKKDSTLELIKQLAKEDDELDKRIYNVEWHYNNRAENVEELAGASLLEEIISEQLKARGFDPVEAQSTAQAIVTEVENILGRPGSRSIVIKTVDNDPVEFVSAGRNSIYKIEYRTTKDGDTRKIKTLIVAASPVLVRRLIEYPTGDMSYEVVLNTGERLMGSMNRILQQIKTNYGLESRHYSHVSRLLQKLADENTEGTVYYAPGYWIHDGKLVIASSDESPSYHRERWDPPPKCDDPDICSKAAETLMNFIMGYKRPDRALAVLAYSVVAPFAYHIKSHSGIFPSLLIIGSNNTGKSTLLDMILLLLNKKYIDKTPMTPYQFDLLASSSTIPALVDEVGSIFASNRNNVADLFNEAATRTFLRERHGSEYSGKYIIVRSFILATNAIANIPIHMKDKYIFVEFDEDSGIDLSKATGYTPRTMDETIRKYIPRLGREMIECVYHKIQESDIAVNRIEMTENILEIGHECIRKTLAKYGASLNIELSPNALTDGDAVDDEITILSDFPTWITQAINGKLNLSVKVTDQNILKALENHDIVVTPDRIYLKYNTMYKYAKWLDTTYGITRYRPRRLARLLGLKQSYKPRIGHYFIYEAETA